VIEKLAEHYQVLIFDNRGCGQTRDNNIHLTAQVLAEDILYLLSTLNMKKPHLVGHSMGGQIAQIAASAFPIGRLVLLNSSAYCRLPPLKAFQALLDMRKLDLPFDVIFNTAIPWFYGSQFLQNEKKLEQLKEGFIHYPYPQSIADQERQLQSLAQFDGSEFCKKIEAPTLIAYSSEDAISLSSESEHLASQIPKARLEKIDSGHASVTEAPEAVASLILNFL
jgi:pimeloyl-ACP methyl ester carboxylesterase